MRGRALVGAFGGPADALANANRLSPSMNRLSIAYLPYDVRLTNNPYSVSLSRMKAKSPRPKLDRPAIVDATIARIEQHGLDELSARKLAQDLGCEAMSLYHHVSNMEALKDLIVDRLLGSIEGANRSTELDSLQQEAEGFLELAAAYPRSFQLIATRRWKGEQAVTTATRAIAHFVAMGFDSPEALARARALGAYLNGAGLALAAWATDPGPNGTGDEVAGDLRRGLCLVLRSLTKTD